MRSIAISKLKATLSAQLERVRRGETLVVTDRGRPIVQIVAIEAAGQDHDLQELQRLGLVRAGSRRLRAGFWKRRRPEDRTGAVRGAVAEERDTGW